MTTMGDNHDDNDDNDDGDSAMGNDNDLDGDNDGGGRRLQRRRWRRCDGQLSRR